jgi:hypothetical protein
MKPTIPQPWYFTPAEVAAEWGVHPDRVTYYADAGLFVPAVAIPRARLGGPLPHPSPILVVMLDRYAELVWDEQPDPQTLLVGMHRCFQTTGIGFKSFDFDFTTPVSVHRSDLVVCLDQRDDLEAAGRRTRFNQIERRTLLQIIAIMARQGYGNDLRQPYQLGDMISKDGQLLGIELSNETIAQKIKQAADLLPPPLAAAA